MIRKELSWGPLLLCLFGLGCLFLAAGVLLGQLKNGFLQDALPELTTFLVGILTIAFVCLDLRRVNRSDLLAWKLPVPRVEPYRLIALFLFLMLIQSAVIGFEMTTLFKLLPADASGPSSTDGPMIPGSTSSVLLIYPVLVAPLAEELFFRVYLFHLLARRWSWLQSALVVAFVFGVFHRDLFGSAAFSIVMSLLLLRTGSLLYPVLFHAGNNLLAFGTPLVLSRFFPEDGGSWKTDELNLLLVVTGLLLVVLVPLFVMFVRRYLPRKPLVTG